MSVTNTTILKEIQEVKIEQTRQCGLVESAIKMSKENNRALKGHNGDTGLVAKAEAMQELLEKTLEAATENNIALNGKGKELGLMSIVNGHMKDHASSQETKEEAEKERRAFWRKVTLVVIGVVATNIGVILVTALTN